MYLALGHPSDIRDLSVEQLQYIPKVVLLRMYGDYIEHVWDKLLEHVKADSEVRTYRRCDEHYNTFELLGQSESSIRLAVSSCNSQNCR